MRNLTKKQTQKFYNSVVEYLNSITIVDTPTYLTGICMVWPVDTTLGVLKVSLFPSESHKIIPMINSKFEEPKRAAEHVDCNPHSGKWNFYEPTGEECLETFKANLSRILIKYTPENGYEKELNKTS